MADIYHYEKKHDEQTMIKTDTGKRKKEQYIENLREGDVVNDFFAVKLKNPPRPYKKGTWFDFVALDKTGEIGVKFWGGENKDRVKRLYDSFSIGDVVQVRSGYVEIWEDRPQISINETTGGLRRCSPGEYDISDFIPSLDEPRITELYTMVTSEIKALKNDQLRSLLKLFFDDPAFVNEFKHVPSAMTHHHNYVGGNLEHTVGVIRLCTNICGMYPDVDKDLLITGAILHDVGKLKEYVYEAAVDKTESGHFIGHIVLGDRWIREKIELLRKNDKPFDPALENQLMHLILSHHGRQEWGSPVLPKTVEACILHHADLMDSQVKNYLQQVENSKKATGDKWSSIYDSDLKQKRIVYLGDH
jgi:3'-5' exoribonuclease